MRVRRAHVKSCARGGAMREHGGRPAMAASLRTLPALCSLLLTPALLEATRLAYALAWWQRRWARPIVASATCSA